jgi:putative Holliday junction resolvase
MDTKGKVMAIDLGEKRIGLAVSDATRTIAKAYGILTRKSRQEDFRRYAAIIAEQPFRSVAWKGSGLPG